MNVERMRRQLERAEAATARGRVAAWWDEMTPEHRAIHEDPRRLVCPTCCNAAFAVAAERISALALRVTTK